MSNRRTVAMDVNDDAGSLAPRGVLKFIVGAPPGACSLLAPPDNEANRLQC